MPDPTTAQTTLQTVQMLIQAGFAGFALVLTILLVIVVLMWGRTNKWAREMERRHDEREKESNKLREQHTTELHTLSSTQSQLSDALKLFAQASANGSTQLQTALNEHDRQSNQRAEETHRMVRATDELVEAQTRLLKTVASGLETLPGDIQRKIQKDLEPVATDVHTLVATVKSLDTTMQETKTALVNQVKQDAESLNTAFNDAMRRVETHQTDLTQDVTRVMGFLESMQQVSGSLNTTAAQIIQALQQSGTSPVKLQEQPA